MSHYGRGGSRDYPRTYRGGNERYYGGRGGGRGPRGGGRDRGGRGPQTPRPKSLEVKTNFFKVKIGIKEVFQYHIQIVPAVVKKVKDKEGNVVKDENGRFIRNLEIKPGRFSEKLEKQLNHGSSPLTRRILGKLQQDLRRKENLLFVTDGSALGYAPSPLFTEKDVTPESKERDDGPSSSGGGIYGGADDGSHFNRPEGRTLKLTRMYDVTVKKDCDENDPMQDRVKNSHFKVQLTYSDKIPVHSAMERHASSVTASQRLTDGFRLTQCVDTIVKNAMMSNMLTSGRSPKLFYFHEDDQRVELLGDELHGKFYGRHGEGRPFAPFVGLTQAIRFCQSGNVFLSVDSAVSWFHRENYLRQNQPIPILNEREQTLAGVRIPGGFHTPITDERIKMDIRERLKKLTFHVKYERKFVENDFVKALREKGLSESEIRRKNVYVRRNKHMVCVDGQKAEICWSADDPSEYCFFPVTRKKRRGKDSETKEDDGAEEQDDKEPPPVRHTVASYFLERYGIKLNYPKMPIIYTGGNEYYPVEFLNQALEKVVGANDPDKIMDVLKYNDKFASTERIDHIQRLKQMANDHGVPGKSLYDLMRQFNITVNNEPETFRAVVLPEPTLKFSDAQSANIRNGSWNLNRVRFSSPADLCSFAVIDLGYEGGSHPCHRFMKTLFRVMFDHGMKVPRLDDHMLNRLTQRVPGRRASPEQIFDVFKTAITQAKSFFFENEYGFLTNVSFTDGSLRKCVVMRDKKIGNDMSSGDDDFIAIRNHPNAPSHWIKNKNTGRGCVARIQFKSRRGGYKDPCDQDAIEEACGVCYILIDDSTGRYERSQGRDSVDTSEIEEAKPLYPVKSWQIECPSIVFVYLPNDNQETYHFVKLLSQWKFGVNCQCVVQEKFASQRGDGAQYCSNIALKVNTKLFSHTNGARAWKTFHNRIEEGIPWIVEAPTLVIGISLSHGISQAGQTVIGASVCLDDGCMQMSQELKVQAKSDIVSSAIMKDIVKSLAIQYYQHRSQKPKRVLVFRDGASEGSFDEIVCTEVGAVRRAFYELNKSSLESPCPNESNCKENGCVLCTPPITYVVAQNDHNIRVVPSLPNYSRGKLENVPSGTVVDSVIMSFQNGMKLSSNEDLDIPKARLFQSSRDEGFDFLLTAQGGLKGTSKPVYYRILLNENYIHRPDGERNTTSLTKDALQKVVYSMAFQYGTATKAPRKLPVVLYSERLASQAISYVGYLNKKKGPDFNWGVTINNDSMQDPNRFYRAGMDNTSTSEEKTELLKGFGPFEQECTESPYSWRVPFRPHIAG